MAHHHKEYKQLSCRDFGADCDFMVRAETAEEIMKYGHDHGCHVHGKCGSSPESEKKMKSLIKNVWV
jgi:predicted small metal-binding protein